MSKTPKDDEAKFNETLQRMLKTPPKPHENKGALEKIANRESSPDNKGKPPVKKLGH